MLKLKGTQIAIGTANTVGGATVVRCFNSNTTTAAVLTIAYANAVAWANCSVGPQAAETVLKASTDTVAMTGGLGVSVAISS